MPVVIFFAYLDLEQESSFMDRHSSNFSQKQDKEQYKCSDAAFFLHKMRAKRGNDIQKGRWVLNNQSNLLRIFVLVKLRARA